MAIILSCIKPCLAVIYHGCKLPPSVIIAGDLNLPDRVFQLNFEKDSCQTEGTFMRERYIIITLTYIVLYIQKIQTFRGNLSV